MMVARNFERSELILDIRHLQRKGGDIHVSKNAIEIHKKRLRSFRKELSIDLYVI